MASFYFAVGSNFLLDSQEEAHFFAPEACLLGLNSIQVFEINVWQISRLIEYN
jgi:hypothetical protein